MSAWIEMSKSECSSKTGRVALYMSAWIEIIISDPSNVESHRRTLHECVDWNTLNNFYKSREWVALYMSAWIEIRKRMSPQS